MLAPWKKSHDQPRQHIKKQRHYFAYKGLYSQSDGFSCSHVWMWELDHKEGWVPKNWCFWTVVLEKTLESPLDCKEIKSVHPKGNQSWIFSGRTDGWSWNSNTLTTWCKEVTHWKKTLMLGKTEGRKRTEQQKMMVGWHHWLNGYEFEQAPGDGNGQRSLVCCSPWAAKSQIWLNNWTTTRC